MIQLFAFGKRVQLDMAEIGIGYTMNHAAWGLKIKILDTCFEENRWAACAKLFTLQEKI